MTEVLTHGVTTGKYVHTMRKIYYLTPALSTSRRVPIVLMLLQMSFILQYVHYYCSSSRLLILVPNLLRVGDPSLHVDSTLS